MAGTSSAKLHYTKSAVIDCNKTKILITDTQEGANTALFAILFAILATASKQARKYVMAIKKRGNKLSLYKRVPRRYQSVEPRKFIWLALHTDSQTEAERKAGPAWQQLIEGWEAKLAGDTSDAEKRFSAARDLAAARGFRYMRADDVAQLPKAAPERKLFIGKSHFNKFLRIADQINREGFLLIASHCFVPPRVTAVLLGANANASTGECGMNC